MSLEERKTKEGEEHLMAAAKYLETSAWKLKFSPDWDSASDEFNKAAVCFKVGKSWEKAKESHLKAAEAYANCGNLYHAGKQLEQAINIVRDLGQVEEVESLAARGGLLYRQAGSPESAAQLMVRAAKLLELKDPGRAVGLYQKAADTVATEDRESEAAGHLEQAAKLCVRSAQYDKAAELLENCLSIYSNSGRSITGNPYGRLVLAFVIVQERRGDCVAASKVWAQWGGFCDGHQAAAARDIVTAYSESDPALARRGLASPAVKTLDNEYVKLARDLDLPPGGDGEEGELDLC